MVDETTDAAATAATEQTATAEAGDAKTFTQAELDEIIRKRLDREGKKSQSEIDRLVDERLKAELDKQKLSAEEQAKIRAEEAEKKSAEVMARANARLVLAEAKTIALSQGVIADYVDDVLSLANISGEAYITDGDPDAEKIQTAIKALLEKRPFYKTAEAGELKPASFGREFGAAATQSKLSTLQQQRMEALKAGNLTESMRLANEIQALNAP